MQLMDGRRWDGGDEGAYLGVFDFCGALVGEWDGRTFDGRPLRCLATLDMRVDHGRITHQSAAGRWGPRAQGSACNSIYLIIACRSRVSRSVLENDA
jgi:hypothetical protein